MFMIIFRANKLIFVAELINFKISFPPPPSKQKKNVESSGKRRKVYLSHLTILL